MRKITRIQSCIPRVKKKLRVAAYARISMESERMNHSLSAQISYYNELIQKNPEWTFAGIYSDDGISGTGAKKRDGFQRLIADCEAGKIDIVLTKSISRFARNTVDLLKAVRRLKAINVDIHFEKEHLQSMSTDGELMLTILASFAQEESRSISKNIKWSIQKRYQRGELNGGHRLFGYHWDGQEYVIEENEANAVKQTFDKLLKGDSPRKIAKWLNSIGHSSIRGNSFSDKSVRSILRNVTYTGNMLLQKTYVADTINRKVKKNNGELPQYYIENSHPAIIDLNTYQSAQKELDRRMELGVLANMSHSYTCFTRKIRCGLCGKFYTRYNDKKAGYEAWICGTRNVHGSCRAKYLPKEILMKVCAEVLQIKSFDANIFSHQIEMIEVPRHHELVFRFYSGKVVAKHWESKSRKEWWTPERRAARSEHYHQIKTNPNVTFSTKIRCGKCGRNYRRVTAHYKDGTIGHYWKCPGRPACNSLSITESIVENCIAKAMEVDLFDEKMFDKLIDYIDVTSTSKLTIHFKDGRNVEMPWVAKIRKPWGKENDNGKESKNNSSNN